MILSRPGERRCWSLPPTEPLSIFNVPERISSPIRGAERRRIGRDVHDGLGPDPGPGLGFKTDALIEKAARATWATNSPGTSARDEASQPAGAAYLKGTSAQRSGPPRFGASNRRTRRPNTLATSSTFTWSRPPKILPSPQLSKSAATRSRPNQSRTLPSILTPQSAGSR